MLEDQNGTFWLAAAGIGFYSINHTENKTILQKQGPEETNRFKYNDVTDLVLDSDKLWISFIDEGIVIYNINSKKYKHYINSKSDKFSLSEDGIRNMYKDNSGRMWICTNSSGIDVYDPYYKPFNTITTNDCGTGLANSNITSILESSPDKIWFGNYSGLNWFNPFNGEIGAFHTSNPVHISLNTSGPECLYRDTDHNLWYGTWDRGLYKISPDNKILSRYTTQNSPLKSNIICHITSDGNTKMYFATFGGGLYSYDYKNNQWETFLQDEKSNKGISYNTLQVLMYDSRQNLWIGTVGKGLDIMSKDANGNINFKNYQDTGDSTGINGNTVLSFCEDSYGNVWIGTSNGLNRFDPGTGTFKSFFPEDGLTDNPVMGIVEDNDKNLWISTIRGITKLNIPTMKFSKYTVLDGIQEGDFLIRSFCKTKSGHIYFGGTNGVTFFHPDEIVENPYPPKIEITSFKIFNEPVKFGEK
ncbi:MAG: hypothetical protein HC906_11565 [Bacteroidales bacterium]|nr:hypothetical protein [Bacteroidales bacterium]